MGRNEIRLRRGQMSSGRIARHRNYGELMRQHGRDLKMKRVFRAFIYFLVALFFTIILIIVIRWEQRLEKKAMNQIKKEIQFPIT
jgi:cbb3-type cytochrome oxidase subunit 3